MKTKKPSDSIAEQVQTKLQRGLSYHQQGDLDMAKTLYQDILHTQPKQADCLHLLGVIAAQSNQHQKAIDLISQAIAVIPRNPHFYLNRGLALKELKQHEEAIANYDTAIALDPSLVELHSNRAIALIELHRFDEGIKSSHRAIALNPNHAVAHFNLGIALSMLGQPEKAIASFERAIAINPDYAEALVNLGIAQKNLNQPEAAIASFNRALVIKPDYDQAYSYCGEVLKGLNQLDAAIDCFNHAIQLNPNRASDFFHLGHIQAILLQPDAAIANFDRAIALDPDFVDAYANRGTAQKELDQNEAAIASYDQALALRPDFAEVHSNRGAAFNSLKLFDAALASYDRAIALKPDFADAYSNRGVVYKELKLLEAAAASFEQAYTIDPDNAAAYSNHGTIYNELKLFNEAIADYNCAIGIDPNYAHAYSNRGVVYQELNQLENAISDFSRAIEIDPNFADAITNKSFSVLLSGNFEEGWKLYEWRLKSRNTELTERYGTQPHWIGLESLNNKTILLHSEQGFGDTIQFCRYAKLVANLGAKVILEVEKPLITLFKTLDDVDQLIVKGEDLPPYDYHCPLMSLPLAFKTTLATIPNAANYLSSNPSKMDYWSTKLNSITPNTSLRVGLVWSGNIDYKNDRSRSIPLSLLLSNLPPEFHYVSLQKEIRDSDKSAIKLNKNFSHFGDEFTDFSDTAALCQLMDVIISVDTGTAHLAGALGKNTWVLLPFSPDFRWLLNRDDSPWYPSIKLFRQSKKGDWDSVFEKIRENLKLLG